MLHILKIAVRLITHAFASAINNSQILMFSRITFHTRRKFGYYFRGPAKWRVTVSGELRLMTSYLES